ncbi:DUF4255 domain-containing protein [Streptomyces sp. NPDC002688]|uniref:DUF4255 domain-containing protein n=1 Tax=Streptomyces sp. NPDC002688 TaxID=3154423 RepID=UPI00331806DD
MSNHLAIAAATSTLRYVLARALRDRHPGSVADAQVTTLRPDRLGSPDLGQPAGVNVFLYLVTPNAALRSTDLPQRDHDATFLNRPLQALDLHYLITCHGKDSALEAQRLLGRAVTALAVNPVLGPRLVAAAVAAYAGVDDTAFLKDSDLADQLEPVRVTPTSLSSDELSKLWSVFPQTPYQLSMTYTATVVLLEAPVTTHRALPVRDRTLRVAPAAGPRLVSVGDVGADAATVPGAAFDLRGERLLGLITRVRLGPVELAPLPGATSSLLSVVAGADVPAGLHPIQVLHLAAQEEPGDGPPVRVVGASNALPVTIRPTVTRAVSDDNGILLEVTPPLFAGQRATVRFSRPAGAGGTGPDTVTVVLPPGAPGTPPQPSLRVPHREVPFGAWLVRVQVDGVESLPEPVGRQNGSPAVRLSPS